MWKSPAGMAEEAWRVLDEAVLEALRRLVAGERDCGAELGDFRLAAPMRYHEAALFISRDLNRGGCDVIGRGRSGHLLKLCSQCFVVARRVDARISPACRRVLRGAGERAAHG